MDKERDHLRELFKRNRIENETEMDFCMRAEPLFHYRPRGTDMDRLNEVIDRYFGLGPFAFNHLTPYQIEIRTDDVRAAVTPELVDAITQILKHIGEVNPYFDLWLENRERQSGLGKWESMADFVKRLSRMLKGA